MRWPTWLRPQWIALAVVALAFTYLCFTVLAPWQLGKNTKTSRENDQIATSLSADPVPVTTFLPQQDSAAPDAQWRRVTATGHYLADKQILARLRPIDGEPAFEVLVPFAVQNGPTVLVNRGYVRPAGGSHVPPIEAVPTGTVSIAAWLRDSETAPKNKAPLDDEGVKQVYAIDTAQLATLFGVPLTESYLQLVDDQPGGLGVRSLPHLDAGPFLSYGIQWIAFGILAPIGLGYFVWAEMKARRRERQEREQASQQASEQANATESGSATPVTVEEKLADRYGRRR